MTNYQTLEEFQKRLEESMNNKDLTEHCDWYWKADGVISEAERNGTVKQISDKEYLENARRQSKDFVEIIKKCY